MRLLKFTGKYFQSYESIEFDFDYLGAALIGGETKAGKSTLMDGPCWVLFGTTSKDSGADDVRSWFADKEKTEGTTLVSTEAGEIRVTRIRGKRSSENDLFYQVTELSPTDGGSYLSDPIRGKDANDTQRKINQLLGVTPELYLEASYMHQFSRADSFFTAKAKDRRDVIEKIQDLTFPNLVAERASEARRQAKKAIETVELERARLIGKHETMATQVEQLKRARSEWEGKRASRLAALGTASEGFEDDKTARVDKIVTQLEELDRIIDEAGDFKKRKAQLKKQIQTAESLKPREKEVKKLLTEIEQQVYAKDRELQKLEVLDGTCPMCLGPTDNPHRAKHMERLTNELEALKEKRDPLKKEEAALEKAAEQHLALLESYRKVEKKEAETQVLVERFEALRMKALSIREEKNNFTAQIEELKKETNPHTGGTADLEKQIEDIGQAVNAKSKAHVELVDRVSALSWLYDKTFDLKAAMLKDSVDQLEARTNEILTTYFDGELRVQFGIEDGDKIEVKLYNNGFDCPYKQLSGGERCMLKLAFGVAFMEAAQNTAGVHISTVMLDEALNGLDAPTKVKAYGLIQYLSTKYESVLVIEHSEELKSMFDRQFMVTKESSRSHVREV